MLGRTRLRQEMVMIVLHGKGKVPVDMLGRTRPRQETVSIIAGMANKHVKAPIDKLGRTRPRQEMVMIMVQASGNVPLQAARTI